MEPLEIYTDGSSLQHPRAGGIGIRILSLTPSGEEEPLDIPLPGFKNATNNQMELQASITALNEATSLGDLSRYSKIVIYTDSLYIVENHRKAMFQWPKTRWRLASGKPVLNAELWQALVKAMRRTGKRVDFNWVKGHSRSEHNKAVDRLAKQSARNALNEPISFVNVRRKLTKRSVQQGSVRLQGQRLTIRVVTAEYLPVHRIWKYKYEVISRSSPFKGSVDTAYSPDLLKAGHTYYVRVGDSNDNPTIEKVFREVGT